MNPPDLPQYIRQCKREYLGIARQVRRRGVDARAVQAALDHHTDRRPARWLVTPDAYLPTGAALGCPLPGPINFARLAALVETSLNHITGLDPAASQRTFIHVPPASLHITIANRSHFEHTAMLDLQPEEFAAARRLIQALAPGPIRVLPDGLLLTASGRLIVRCLPLDTKIFTLRQALQAHMPGIWIQVPRIIHIKLGHLAVPLSPAQVLALEGCLHRIEQHLSEILTFTDVVTPCGRISLSPADP